MRGWGAVRLIARREIVERLRSRATWLMTVLSTVLVVGFIVVPAVVRLPARATVVALVGAPAQALRPDLQAAAAATGVLLELVDAAGPEEARAAVEGGSRTVALELTEDGATLATKQDVAPAVQGLVRGVLDQAHLRRVLSAAGVPPDALRQALTPAELRIESLQPRAADFGARIVAAIVTGYLLFYGLLGYATSVAVGVAQEKTSRTAEVLLATVRPAHLLTGKVLGIGLAGLGQMGITVVAGLLANGLVKGVAIPDTVVVLLPTILLWFLLGYALYAFASAAAGALVARPEEVGSAAAPFTMVLIVALLLVYAVVYLPETWYVVALSLVPAFTPVLLPARMAMGAVPWWEIVLAIGLTLAATYGVVRLGARIYTGSLMRGGARISWGTALRRGR